ncbi:MAG: hypothetical protein HY675_22060 [Chloroflexi bacterium]|nr:hypothetical protein [Chloroflexota bacterium]
MNKNIGFNRNIYLPWLDATAAFCAEVEDAADIRSRLDAVVGQSIGSTENRRKAIDILVNIWVKTREKSPELRSEAVAFFRSTTATSDRLWLHYGLCLLYYPFFRQTTAALGQVSRNVDTVTPALVKQRLVAERGALGSLAKAVERIVFSLRDWGIVARADKRFAYRPCVRTLTASRVGLETWILACALHAHPSEDILFADLVRLPELFPFRLTLSIDDLRRDRRFGVQRQGASLEMVRLVKQ